MIETTEQQTQDDTADRSHPLRHVPAAPHRHPGVRLPAVQIGVTSFRVVSVEPPGRLDLQEYWLDLPGHEGEYSVSSFGCGQVAGPHDHRRRRPAPSA